MKKIDLYDGQWLIVTDLDGTFLSNSPNFAIPAKNIEAVRRLTEQGHKFVLASGRSPQLMRFIHSHLELDTPMISFHGSLITDPSGKNPEFKLENKFIEKKVMIDLIQQLDLFDISTSTHLIGIDKAIEINDVEDLHELDFDVYEGVIMAETDNDIDRERIAKLIEDNFGNHVAFKYLPGGSGVKQDLLLFVASGTDKVHAIKELQEYYGIPQERIMYFGDNTNDLKAIKYAGVGVAVESGKDHVKSEADMIAEGSNHDGAVGKFILKLLEK